MENITCLGRTFNNEDQRREYFRNELRKKLPELKNIDGFPIGEDDDIIALSDPPFYTACPNPWLNEFIKEWEQEKVILENSGIRQSDFIVSEPYASDISEGKNNPLYAAHSYHTKVPHLAILRYILHYTNPGDIVFDGFAGTGMTAVATNTSENPDLETKYKIEAEWQKLFGKNPSWGSRKSIISDLSPIASFIAHNYNTPINLINFEREIKKIIEDFNQEYGWMYQTHHSNGKLGKINFVVWSEMLRCPNCQHEFVFSNELFDKIEKRIIDENNCKNCNSLITKESCDLVMETYKDKATGELIARPKRVLYLINYSMGKQRFEKIPDENDYKLLRRIEDLDIPDTVPIFKLPDIQMAKVGRVKTTNITHIHHFFLHRELITLSFFWKRAKEIKDTRVSNFLLFTIEQMIWGFSVLNRYSPSHFSQVNRYLSGVFYVASHLSEVSPNYLLDGKIKRIIQAFNKYKITKGEVLIGTTDCASIHLKSNSIDYIFTDPPFGENIYYSDLNLLIEGWHKILTNYKNEAIIDKARKKGVLEYQLLMEKCFLKYYDVLKPGKWMTVEFSNTSAAVWNGIQTAIKKAGFVIANVSALDKQQGTFQAVNSPTAVKQDLVISSYKPISIIPEDHPKLIESTLWTFVSEYLDHLPIHIFRDNCTAFIAERGAKLLFDKVISYYIIKGFAVPIDAKNFQIGLKSRFVERDGMFFNHHQINEYEIKKSISPSITQISWQIATEGEGVEWLRRELNNKMFKYQDIQPKWMQAITAVRKGDILPELRDILQQNFIEESDGSWRVPDLNEAKDREIIRNKALLKEFNSYVELANNSKSKRMKEVRVESLRAGFKHCWDIKDFQTIIKLSDKIPQNLLLEDEQLLMYYDIAKDRV